MASTTKTETTATEATEEVTKDPSEMTKEELLAHVAALTATKAAANGAKREAARRELVIGDERLAWVVANARPAESDCLCGCGGKTKGRFVPGHDAKLKSELMATAEFGTDEQKAQANAALATFGW